MSLFSSNNLSYFKDMIDFSKKQMDDNVPEFIIRERLKDILFCKNKYSIDKIADRQVSNIIKISKSLDSSVENKKIFFCKNELDFIHSFNNINDEHVLFILFCLYKCYGDFFRFKDSELYREAKVTKAKSDLSNFIGSDDSNLFQINKKGYEITYRASQSIKDLYDSNNVLEIVNKSNIVYYYDEYFNNGRFIRCECCGCIDKKRSNVQRYCKSCSVRNKNHTMNSHDAIIRCKLCGEYFVSNPNAKRDVCDDCYRQTVREKDRIRKSRSE